MRRSPAFSLVELLLVVVVVGVLAAIAIPNFLSSRIKARDAPPKHKLELALRAAHGIWTLNETFPATIDSDLGQAETSLGTVSACASPCTSFPPSGQVSVERQSAGKITLRAQSVTGHFFAISEDLSDPTDPIIARGSATSLAQATTRLTNIVPNPSFEKNLTGWLACGNAPRTETLQRTTAWATSGSYSLRAYNNPNNNCGVSSLWFSGAVLAVSPSTVYSARADVNVTTAAPSGVRISLTFFDNIGNILGSNCDGLAFHGTGVAAVEVDSCTSPILATKAAVWVNTPPNALGTFDPIDFMVDSVAVFAAPTAIGYVDGDGPGGTWNNGTPHNSPSTGYAWSPW